MVTKQREKVDLFDRIKVSGEIVNEKRIRSGGAMIGMASEWKITIMYGSRQYTFNYTNSVNNGSKKPSKKDLIYCLISDSGCFHSSRDLEDFAYNFGYENIKDAEKAYKACARTAAALSRVFGKDLAWFEKELENY